VSETVNLPRARSFWETLQYFASATDADLGRIINELNCWLLYSLWRALAVFVLGCLDMTAQCDWCQNFHHLLWWAAMTGHDSFNERQITALHTNKSKWGVVSTAHYVTLPPCTTFATVSASGQGLLLKKRSVNLLKLSCKHKTINKYNTANKSAEFSQSVIASFCTDSISTCLHYTDQTNSVQYDLCVPV